MKDKIARKGSRDATRFVKHKQMQGGLRKMEEELMLSKVV